MNQDSINNNQTPNAGTPLSVFQAELARHKSGQKSKKFLYIILPVLIALIIIGAYFAYRYFKIQKQEADMIQNIENVLQKNDEFIKKAETNPEYAVPESAINDAMELIEKTKLDSRYGTNQNN